MTALHRAFTLTRDRRGTLSKQPRSLDESSTTDAEYEIENNLGVPMLFWEANQPVPSNWKDSKLAQHEGVYSLLGSEEIMLPADVLIRLRNENRRKQGIALEDDLLSLGLKLRGFQGLPRVPVELSGTFAYSLQPETPGLDPITLCVATRPTGRHSKHVSLQSSILLCNNTRLSLRIFAIECEVAPHEDDVFDEIDKTAARFELLSPGEVFKIPLAWVTESLCVAVQVSHNG